MAYRKPQTPTTKRKPKTALADLGRHVLKSMKNLKKPKPKIKPKIKPKLKP